MKKYITSLIHHFFKLKITILLLISLILNKVVEQLFHIGMTVESTTFPHCVSIKSLMSWYFICSLHWYILYSAYTAIFLSICLTKIMLILSQVLFSL